MARKPRIHIPGGYYHVMLRGNGGMKLSEYQWSSHAAYLGNEELPWLESETVLTRFSDRLDQARERYSAFISDGMREPHRPEFHGGASDARVIGCDDFAEKVLAHQNNEKARYCLDDCIETVCRFYELQPCDLSKHGRMRKPSEARAVVAWLIRQYGSETLSDVARRFGRDVATMSAAVRRIEEKLLEFDTVRGKLAEIEKQIMNTDDLF